MSIKAGDKVKFLNEVGGGVVRRIDSRGIAFVQTDDDFEVPVVINELLKSEEDFEVQSSEPVKHKSPQKNTADIIHTDIRYYKREGELFPAFVPKNEDAVHHSDIILYLINDCNYPIHYLLSYTDTDVFVALKHGILEADMKMKVKVFSQTDISKIKTIKLQGFWFKDGLLDVDNMIDYTWDISSVIFYKPKAYHENDYFEEKACVLTMRDDEEVKLLESTLDAHEIAAAMMEKESDKEKKKEGKSAEIEEVDLHIEEIVDEHKELSNGEILNIQLDRFETALITAIHSNTSRIVFIHGVGNGKLKYELCKILDNKYADLAYQDASFKEYGYGATMVKLR